MTENKSTTRSTEFTCHASGASKVFLAGTFNGWAPEEIPMKKNKKYQWITSLELTPGRYEFKFIVDGKWCCEVGCEEGSHGCPRCVPNEFGTMNRVIEVV